MDERLYDLIFICRPATPEDEISKIVATIEHSATEHGGKIEKIEKRILISKAFNKYIILIIKK